MVGWRVLGTAMLLIAAILVVLTGIAHSYLGERYILVRLFRREGLPRLFGGTAFTVGTLRFACTSPRWRGSGWGRCWCWHRGRC